MVADGGCGAAVSMVVVEARIVNEGVALGRAEDGGEWVLREKADSG